MPPQIININAPSIIMTLYITCWCYTAHGGVNSLRKASTESKQENEAAELGPFGSSEALDVLNKAAKLVYCSHHN